MMDRAALLQALETITTARRDAQAALDTTRTAHLAATEPIRDEQRLQMEGALVRQLENASRELADAIRTINQRAHLEATAADA